MVLSTFDHNDLVLTLFESLFAPEPWDTFLRRLLARTGAQRIVLGGGWERRVAAREGGSAEAGAEQTALSALGEPGLRANRVYALEELLDFDDPARRARQSALLAEARIGDARLIRVSGAETPAVTIALLHERAGFGAAESALLTALAPAVGIAAANLAAIAVQQVRLAAAEDTLARLGIGQAVLDRHGQVLAADRLWPAHAPGAAMLAEACRLVGAAGEAVPVPLALRGDPARRAAVLLRPLPPGPTLPAEAAAVATLRTGRAPDPAQAARVIAAELGLTPREAALAAQLAAGQSLVEAGRALRLTDETARNYSKRIYAKTGARGQAELVRMVLQGLAALA